jgi:hypothetical protein
VGDGGLHEREEDADGEHGKADDGYKATGHPEAAEEGEQGLAKRAPWTTI